jgi:cytochrome c5
MRLRILFYLAASLVASVALAQPMAGGPAGPAAPAAGGVAQSNGGQKGEAVLQRACTSCHSIDLTTGQPRSRDEWTEMVSRMVGNGAQLTDDEYNTLIDYLATQYGPRAPNAPAN